MYSADCAESAVIISSCKEKKHQWARLHASKLIPQKNQCYCPVCTLNPLIMRNSSATSTGPLTERMSLYFYNLNLSYAPIFGGILCLLLSWKVLSRNFRGSKGAGPPIIDQGQWWDVFNLQPKFTFYLDGRKGIENAYQKACGKPFRMLGVGALVTILPPEYADEIRNDKNLDFSKVVSKVGSPVLSIT